MSKKVIVIVIVFLVGSVLSFIFFQNSFNKNPPLVKTNAATKTSPQPNISLTTKEFSDPAGFKFSYPNSVSVTQKNTTDDTVYSFLKITSSSTSGNITIKAVSSDLLALDDMLTAKTGVTDVQFADLTAKQYAEKGAVVTLALDKGVLFTITVFSDGNVKFWD